MAKVRNVSDETRLVGYGVPRKYIAPDELLEIPDELIENYDQPGIWAVVEGGTATPVAQEPEPTPAPEPESTPPEGDIEQ